MPPKAKGATNVLVGDRELLSDRSKRTIELPLDIACFGSRVRSISVTLR
jgi:hypothetical protein